MKLKQIVLSTFFVLMHFYSNAQNNSTSVDCGNDPLLGEIGQPGWYYSFVDKDHPCNRFYFDGPMTLNSYANPYPSDWQTVFTDDFNALSLDKNYWRLMFPWGNDVNTPGFLTNIIEPSLNILQNGKLIQKGAFNPQNYNLFDGGGNQIMSGGNPATKYAETQVPFISTIYKLPINCRVRGRIKIIGDCEKNWPAFWLRGADKEIDIFEFTNGEGNEKDDNSPNNYQKMSWGNTMYGYPSNQGYNEVPFQVQFGSDNSTDFSQGFHNFEVIWDQFKIQFWLDGQIIYADYVYFKARKNWSNYKLKRHWRESPVRKPSDLDVSNPNIKYLINKYAIDNLASTMHTVIGFGAPKPGSDYTINQMETDWFSFGLRSDCSSGLNIVNAIDWYDPGQWGGTAYETGYEISTDPNSVLDIQNYRTVFFAATNEIGLNPGLGVESGAVFNAELTACESGWDARTTSGTELSEPSEGDSIIIDSSAAHYANFNPDELEINDEDSIIYFNTLPQFDETNPFTELVNYPDHLTLTSKEELIKSAEIYNMQGELIYKSPNVNSNFISIQKQSSWSTGLYIIRVYSSSTLHIHRVWIRGN